MRRKTGLLLSLCFALVLLAPPLLAMPNTININSADAETLTSQLKGIGPAKAAAIVAFREKNGPFVAVENITLVKGIGWKTMEANRQSIRLSDDDDAMRTANAPGEGGKSAQRKEASNTSGDELGPDSN